jgi:Peptidase family M20/M25/M40
MLPILTDISCVKRTMRVRHLRLLLLTSSLSYVRSLPPGNGKDNNEGLVTSILDSFVVGGRDNQLQDTSSPHRIDVVDRFFEGTITSKDLHKEIKSRAENLTPFVVQTRRILHRYPELMYKEEQTSRIIQSVLTDLNVTFTTGWAKNANPSDNNSGDNDNGGYGIVADLGTGQPPCVLLRADIDALPIEERTEGIDSYRSQNSGAMHACGHDGHTAMLLGATAMLKQMEDSLNGTVRVIFQPAEEGGAGAKRMIEEGLLQMEPKPQHAFG